MQEKLKRCGAVLLLVGVAGLVGVIVYTFGRGLVETFGPLHAVLIVGGWVLACRIADFVAPRRDGESWFWASFRDGGE